MIDRVGWSCDLLLREIVTQRVAYPGGEAYIRGPEGKIWPDGFGKKSSLEDRTKVQSTLSAAARGGEACVCCFVLLTRYWGIKLNLFVCSRISQSPCFKRLRNL